MIMMMLLTMTLALMFIFMNHPLSMGMILLGQTILIALITGFMNINFWFSYIIFLIMVGGMLVLFIYMTSIASNEKFKFSTVMFILFVMTLICSFFTYLLVDNFFHSLEKHSSSMTSNYLFSMNLNKFFNYPSNIILFLMIIYLFFTLIAVVKITNINFGPLRQKF